MRHSFKNISISEKNRRYSTREYIITGIGMVCLVMLLCLSAVAIQQGWNKSDLIYSILIPLIAVLGTAMCLLTKSYFKFGLTDVLVLILYGYFIIRYYTDATYTAASMAILATLALALYFSLRLVFNGTRINGNVISLLILTYTIYETGYGIIQLIEGSSRHYLYPVTGSFHNPGPYSACLVMGLVIICSFIKQSKLIQFKNIPLKSTNTVYVVALSLTLIFICLIIITVSRTALIATALCLFILFWNNMGRWKWLALGLCIGLGVGLYFIKSGSADGRMVINYVGVNAMVNNPIFGNGVGSFFHSFAETTQILSLSGTKLDLAAVDVIEYAFNDWLHIAVELGVVGFLLAVSIMVYSLWGLWYKSLPLFLTLLTILIFSIFSYPIELLPYQIITIMIISISASQIGQMKSKGNKKFIMTALITAVTVICISLSQTNRIKKLVEVENDYGLMRGIYDPALIKDFKQMFPYLEDNRNFLFDYGRILARDGRYNDSNEVLRRGTMVSNDPMFLVLQGNNYRDMGAFDKAEEMYLKAWHTMPNRIYPLYKLMKLFEEIGNIKEASLYAIKILNFNEKVSSPAVNDMKKEAFEITNRSLTNNLIKKTDMSF